MFWFGRKKELNVWGDLEKTNADLEEALERIENLEHEKSMLQSKLDTMELASREAPMSLDFEGMNVVSVERVWEDGHASTGFGYILNGEMHSWYFHCSDATHSRIVSEFDAYRRAK